MIIEFLKSLFVKKEFLKKKSLPVSKIYNRLNLPENIDTVRLIYKAYVERHFQHDYILTTEFECQDCVDKNKIIDMFCKSELFTDLTWNVEDPCTSLEEPTLDDPGNLYIDFKLNFPYKGMKDIENKFLEHFNVKAVD